MTRPAAALLAAGDGAALSHRTAAVVWGLLPARGGDPVDLTLFDARGRSRRGVRAHHAELDPADLRVRHGLKLTAASRTLLDLAATSPRDLEAALNEARILRLVTARELAAQLDRCPRHRGARTLRDAIADGPDLTRSEAERRLLALVRAAGLPMPRTNVRVAGHEVDLYWPDHNLVVEFDGWAYHSTRAAFERDRRRDADLQLAGQRVLRVTHRMLTRGRDALIARLAVALHTPANVNGGIEGGGSEPSRDDSTAPEPPVDAAVHGAPSQTRTQRRSRIVNEFERCYRAVAERDATEDGRFVTAVRTTGVYCRPSCPARTPLAGNVTFYATADEARAAGYRACKRCHP